MASGLACASGAALLVGCGDDAATGSVSVASTEQALIGGHPVAVDYFRSTVGIGDACTGAKVGPCQFLTAAHCVAVPRPYKTTPPPGFPSNDGVHDDYVPGKPLQIQWGLDADGAQGTFTIVETVIHPSWWAYPLTPDPPTGPDGAADIAVIEIAEDTPDIPEARVELDRVEPGTQVVKVGWGCEVTNNSPASSLGRYKAEDAWTLPASELEYHNPPLSDVQFTTVRDSYLVTAGQGQNQDSASLCMGDSGGPLYLPDNSDPRIVGVNSDYIFRDESGISWDDWHTQTALGSHHGVGQWLKDLGVNTVGTPWNLDRIDQRSPTPANGYRYEGDGTGVHVYVFDSGIRATHDQFEGRVAEGWDFVDDDADPDDTGPIAHGTGVASIIGGKDFGVAKNVTLHAMRVLNQRNYGEEADVIDALDWVIANHESPAVINMSFTTSTYVEELERAVERAVDAGITVVVSAGNTGENACDKYPAAFPGVITVGASDPNDARWVADGPESNVGSCVDLFAPGVDVECAGNWDDTASTTGSGTSEATPHVAGAAAIYLAAHPTATPADVAEALLSQATEGALSNIGDGSPNLLLYTSDLVDAGSCTDTVFDAESVSASTGGAVADGWNIWSNGYISFDYRFPVGSAELTVAARGQQGGGAWPDMTVTVNGSKVYSVTVDSASWTDYSFTLPAAAGHAEVRVNFTNDYYANGEDRNLLVDKVTITSCEAATPGGDCTIETAVNLGLDGNNVTVPTDGCVKVDSTYPGWWGTRNMVLQNTTGETYPVPFTWSNACESSSGSGSFETDWGRLVVGPTSDQCPTLVDLQGPPGGEITIRYFGG